MKIAFYVPNVNLKGVDFSTPDRGNPGSGASEYINVALPFYLSDHSCSVNIFAQDITKMPKNIECIKCDSIRDAAIKAKQNGIDLFVFRPRIHEEDLIINLIDEIELISVGIAQLTPSVMHQRKMAKSNYFKALVAVGSEQYDFLCDSPLSAKLTYIDNGVSIQACDTFSGIKKNENLVIYMGALVPQKSFHVLARAWPHIIKRHPDAKLKVIGSSKIYNENYEVGPLGVANSEYEREHIIPYLCDSNLKLHHSVEFMGPLGPEKYKYLSESLIGVVNPLGHTETCCVSAVEMSACSTAVVSGAYYALLGTVKNGVTGLLGRGDKALIDNICYLLSNPNVAIKMGLNGRKDAEAKYDFYIIAKAWRQLAYEIYNGLDISKPQHKFKYLQYHRKFLRVINYRITRILRNQANREWPSIQEIEELLHKVLKNKFINI